MLLGVDPLYWIMMLPVLLLSLSASARVRTVFGKYSKIRSLSGMTGADTARELLKRNGLHNIQVKEASGFLSDHYDPVKRIVRLSPRVFRSPSVAAMGVAAHETGHAIQHKTGYLPLTIRSFMVPLATIGSNFAYIIIIAGLLLSVAGLIKVGLVLFAAVVFFQLVSLPVEFDASRRAAQMLHSYGILKKSEITGVRKVLGAAALTYVAAALSGLITLFYFLLRARR